MLQKNSSLNYNQHQRFGLRKLNIGVASVLLGATYFALNNSVAHADTVNGNNNSQQQISATTQNGGGRASTEIS